MILGIDLGTTNSLAAWLAPGGPQLVPNALGEVLTPSAVGLDDAGTLLVGRPALERMVTHPSLCAATFKRHMGTDWSVQLGGRKFTAIELSSLVLSSLKRDAEAHLGRPVERAVITVPAYFNQLQRQATIQAGQVAGLTVERILNEPTAAAIAYGMHEVETDRVLLVIDLGGGTFDVAIVDRFERVLEIRASSGQTFLGGEDFTNTLVARLVERQGLTYEHAEVEHPLMIARLRHECEAAKRALSSGSEVLVRVPTADGELPVDGRRERVTRDDFDAWTESLRSRLEGPVRRALGDAKLQPGQLDEVILVGGATRMPAVVEWVRRRFGKEPRSRIDPDHVVALGAAVQAGLLDRNEALGDVVVTDVAPFTLGFETCHVVGNDVRPGFYSPVIHRNTTIPCSRVERVSTLQPNQTRIVVEIYQGEHRRVSGNLHLGRFAVDGIPRGPVGSGEVDIRFTYDPNGVLEVEATVVATGRRFVHVVRQLAGGLSDKDVQRTVAELQKYKTHPRDDMPNVLVLRRAERIWAEIPHEARDLLEMLLRGFEEALQLQDAALAADYRERLDAFLDEWDRPFDGGTDAPGPESDREDGDE